MTQVKAEFIKSYSDVDQIEKDGLPHVAILGRSNAGKSTLINSIMGSKKLAKVSSTPGRTRLINTFDIEGRYHLVDLPGYGYAKGSKTDREKLLDVLFGYMHKIERLKFVIVLIDSRHGAQDSDKEMITGLMDARIPFMIIANKVDKLKNRSEFDRSVGAICEQYPHVPCMAHSSITGVGREEIKEAINYALSVT